MNERPSTPSDRSADHRRRAASLLAVVVFAALLVGVCLRSQDRGRYDFAYLYIAGRCWLAGENPYDIELFDARFEEACTPEHLAGAEPAGARWDRFKGGNEFHFVYPPWTAIVAVPFGLMPPNVAFRVVDLVLALSLTLTALAYWRAVRVAGRRPFDFGDALVVGALPLVGGTTSLLRMGQTSTIYVAAIAWLMLIAPRKFDWRIAMLLLLVAVKPTLGGAAFAYFAFASGWRNAAVAVVGVAAVTAAVITASESWPVFFDQYERAVALYDAYAPNKPIKYNSIPALFAPSVVQGAIPKAFALALVGLGALMGLHAAYARKGQPLGQFTTQQWRHRLLDLAIIVGVTLLFSPLHSYDLTLLGVALIGGSVVRSLPGRLALLALIGIAGRHVNLQYVSAELLGGPWRQWWPTMLFAAVTVIFVWLRLRPAPDQADA